MKRNEFLCNKKLLDEIAEIIYASHGKQGWQVARHVLKLINESSTVQNVKYYIWHKVSEHPTRKTRYAHKYGIPVLRFHTSWSDYDHSRQT